MEQGMEQGTQSMNGGGVENHTKMIELEKTPSVTKIQWKRLHGRYFVQTERKQHFARFSEKARIVF
jgi:hypothetical protein